jgi:hypothetical protein
MPTARSWLLSIAPALVLATATPAALATPLQISATARSAMAQPTPAPGSEDLVNGDYTILSNPDWPNNFYLTGDGIDETTVWSFDFTSDPGYAAFVAHGTVTEATYSITLMTKYFFDGVGPPGAITYPSDGVSGVFPLWNLSNSMTGVPGEWSRATFTTQLVGGLGMSGTQLFGWLAGHGGQFPMVFADDAVVVESTLTLMAAPVSEPATAASLAAGLAGLALLLARRRPVLRQPHQA